MSSNRPQQSAGGASSVPSTSGGGSGGSTGSTGAGNNAATGNGSNPGNVVPFRTVAAAGDSSLSVPTLVTVPSSRGTFASLSRPSAAPGSRKKSLHQAPLCNGLLNSYEDKSNDFVWWVFFNRGMDLMHITAEELVETWALVLHMKSCCCSLFTARSASRWSRRRIWRSVATVSGQFLTVRQHSACHIPSLKN